MARRESDTRLDLKQRLTLFSGCGLSTEKMISTPLEEINFEFLIAKGVRALNISASGLRPLALKDFGVTTAKQLQQLGFDSLHLVDHCFCEQAAAAFALGNVAAGNLQHY